VTRSTARLAALLHANAHATVGRLRSRRDRRDRGDVPGWVLITVMTAGLVAALWAVAGPQLSGMLRDALSSVRG
jgi:anti-sigma factor RsiW